MPSVIRRGVFETNSSSTHSITISDKWLDVKHGTLPVEGGVCRVYPGEFGWEEETYYDASSKASYCYEYAKDSQELLDRLAAVIKAEMDCKEVVFEPGEGYIDHQSGGVAGEAFASDEALHSFIFNPNSVLETDNDNH